MAIKSFCFGYFVFLLAVAKPTNCLSNRIDLHRLVLLIRVLQWAVIIVVVVINVIIKH